MPNTREVAIFDQYAAVLETVIDRGMVTMEDKYIVVCAIVLYRILPLLMTLSDPEPQFQGLSIV